MADTLRASERGIALVDQARHRKRWNRTADAWLQAVPTARSTMNRFWARRPIRREIFIGICRAVGVDWREVVEPALLETAAAAIAPEPLSDPTPTACCIGREAVMASLERQLPQLRLLMIVGIAGVGKTELAETLAVRWETAYPQTLPINFEARPRARFAEIAAESLTRLACPSPVADPTPEQLLDQWIEVLATQPCLVVMDSLENLLHGDESTGWSRFQDADWETFFHRLLGLEQCASLVIITSQDVPGQIEVHGLRYGDRYHCERLRGLTPEAQQRFFQAQGLEVAPASEAGRLLARIGAAYEGHLLSLQVIAAEILTVCDGDVSVYWQRYGAEIELLERLQASRDDQLQPGDWRLAQASRQLRKTVRDRIERSFQRLQSDFPDAYLALCCAAAYPDPIVEADFIDRLRQRGWDEERSQTAIDVLLDRCLLWLDRQYHLRQHNLIRSVALNRCFDPASPLRDLSPQ